jgi:hypothetical protein
MFNLTVTRQALRVGPSAGHGRTHGGKFGSDLTALPVRDIRCNAVWYLMWGRRGKSFKKSNDQCSRGNRRQVIF